MDRVLSADEYGICLFSFDVLQGFLKNNKIRSKKLYLTSQKEGIWVPLPQINCFEYIIRLDGYDEPFDDEWEQKIEYSGFNLDIKNGLWISCFGSFFTFQPEEYGGDEGFYAIKTPYGDILHYFSKNERHYKTLDEKINYTDFKYDVPDGKYLLTVKGYVRGQEANYAYGNCGFFFSLAKVDDFDGFKNPRDEEYDFNVGSMK